MNETSMTPERLAEIREELANAKNFSPGTLAALDLLKALDAARARVAELEAGITAKPQTMPEPVSAGFATAQARRGSDPGRRVAWRMLARDVEDPHDSPLHHTYRVSRDLPETDGAR